MEEAFQEIADELSCFVVKTMQSYRYYNYDKLICRFWFGTYCVEIHPCYWSADDKSVNLIRQAAGFQKTTKHISTAQELRDILRADENLFGHSFVLK
jgi:hypothetical protein